MRRSRLSITRRWPCIRSRRPIHDLPFSDGEPIVDEQLAAERELTDILVLRRAGRYVLIANNAIGRETPAPHLASGRRMGPDRPGQGICL